MICVAQNPDSENYLFYAKSLYKANISAELAGGEQRLDGGAEAHDVEHGARRETLQCHHHGFLWKQEETDRMGPDQCTYLNLKTKLWFIGVFLLCLQLTFTRWMLVPLMLPLRSTRNSSSLVALCSSRGSHSKSGQKLSIKTGLLRMSLWYRFLTNSNCGPSATSACELGTCVRYQR